MSSHKKRLCSYIFPAVVSLFVTYLYNVMANVVLSGVVQGLQPLWGKSYGKQDTKEIND